MSAAGAAWQRPEIAEAFVDDRRALIPLIDGQDELVRRLITRGERRIRRFLDLGAGGGAFAELIMETHPDSTGVLVDFSEPMVAAAKERLDRKRTLYSETHSLLEPGGLFLNWEHVATTGLADGMMEEWMIENLVAAERRREHPRPDDEVVRDYLDAADDDILADPYVQCDWLREVGFQSVGVFFQIPEIAIFGGVKGGK
jgi:tRNA (cmo5U34)-methyltransferase